ncbi:hypothetical protein FHS70_005678 [Flammeovirga yaeyamensis]|nr:hypothetical protein [Flammeovirga yaeyamensis]
MRSIFSNCVKIVSLGVKAIGLSIEIYSQQNHPIDRKNKR